MQNAAAPARLPRLTEDARTILAMIAGVGPCVGACGMGLKALRRLLAAGALELHEAPPRRSHGRYDLTPPALRTIPLRRNPRRAYDERRRMIEPGTVADMRAVDGIQSVLAWCEWPGCGHGAVINVDRLDGALYIPDLGLRFVCSRCGGRNISTRPNYRECEAYWRGRP